MSLNQQAYVHLATLVLLWSPESVLASVKYLELLALVAQQETILTDQDALLVNH